MNFLRKTNQLKKDNLAKRVIAFDFSEIGAKEGVVGLALPREGGFAFNIKNLQDDGVKYKYQLIMTTMYEKDLVVVSVETEIQAKEALNMIKKEIVNPWGGVKKWSWIIGIFVLLNLLTPHQEMPGVAAVEEKKVGLASENYDELKQVQEMLAARQKMIQGKQQMNEMAQEQEQKTIKDLGAQLENPMQEVDESLKLLGK